MKNNDFIDFIPLIISFAIVILLPSFVGFKATTIAPIILSTIIVGRIVESLFARFIFKEKKPTKWNVFACITGFVSAIFLLIVAKNPNNVTFWFSVAFLLVSFIFVCIDGKFGAKGETK